MSSSAVAYARKNYPRFVDDLKDLLRIPSISTLPEHAADCRRAAGLLAAELQRIGMENVRLIEVTGGHPLVYADWLHAAGKPTVLVYGHYDVQPPDPLDEWLSPPFEPTERNGNIYARGAVDDKGQTLMFLEALRAWHTAGGGIPARLTLVIEGEEETGSVNLEPFLIANKDMLKSDVALISDTNMWDIDTPAVTTRLRGIAYCEVTLKAASRDLHSGMFGGSALNPINALTRILGDLQDADGRIQLPGFYDRVKPVTNAQRAQWDALHFNEVAFLGGIGLSKPVGERGYSALERLWARPTADINGIWGGYTEAGSKTVIASEASAKVSFRLVADQDPNEVYAQFQSFIKDRLPEGATVTFQSHSSSQGIEVNTDQPWVRAAQDVLAAEYGRPAVLIGCGGSVPVVNSMHRVLGIDTLLMGFGLDDDQIHSPNEKFEQRCFHHGIRSHARLLAKFAGG